MNGMLLSLDYSVPRMRIEEVDDVASFITIDKEVIYTTCTLCSMQTLLFLKLIKEGDFWALFKSVTKNVIQQND